MGRKKQGIGLDRIVFFITVIGVVMFDSFLIVPTLLAAMVISPGVAGWALVGIIAELLISFILLIIVFRAIGNRKKIKAKTIKKAITVTIGDLIIAFIVIMIGVILLVDELWMFGFPIGHILPDLSALHVEPFHHWIWGVAMIAGGFVYAITRPIKRRGKKHGKSSKDIRKRN